MVGATNLQEENIVKYTGNSSSLLTKYDIPISHLDFSYVEKCSDGKELEKILHILKSGEEGIYLELIKAVETKLRKINPKSKFLREISRVTERGDLQKHDLDMINEDLGQWISSICRDSKELEAKKALKHSKNSDIPEVRQTKGFDCSSEMRMNIKKEKRIKSTDYSSWDKYDPDTEILKMDLKEEKTKSEAIKKKPQTNKQVTFKIVSSEIEAKLEALKEREKGNEYFKIGDFCSALKHYTTSLKYKKTIECLNNRAITFIKTQQYQNAINDCDSVLGIETENLKANLRKTQALVQLKRFDEAVIPIQRCVRLEPNNQTIQNLAAEIRSKCGIKLVKRRLAIEDVNHVDVQHHETLRNKGKSEKHREKERTTQNSNFLIPIPGTSKMPEPYFVTCTSEDVDKTVFDINSSCHSITFIKTLPEDEEDCTIIHLDRSSSNEVPMKRHLCIENSDSNTCITQDCTRNEKNTIVSTRMRSKLKKLPENMLDTSKDFCLNDRNAGGEPFEKDNSIVIPADIYAPYTFLKTWTAAKHDLTLKKQARIIRDMNMDQLVQVIGCKLDNDMLSIILKTLYEHFSVPGQIEKVFSVLLNLVRLPRFEIIALLMSEQDRKYLNTLMGFLHQHDRSLPDYVKRAFN